MRQPLALGLHPFTRGFGWVLIEAPDQLLDWGVSSRPTERNARCRAAIERLLVLHQPDLVIVEDWRQLNRASRVQRLYAQILLLCAKHKIPCRKIRPDDIRAAFALSNEAGRHDIALAVAERFDALEPRLPKRRMAWDSEHPNMALFAAIAAAFSRFADRSSYSSSASSPTPAAPG